MSSVFITGGTGYMGRHLIPALLKRGLQIRALVRSGSQGKLAPGCEPVLGEALDANSFARKVPPSGTFVQLVGTPKPNPRKAQQFLKSRNKPSSSKLGPNDSAHWPKPTMHEDD